MGTLRADRTPWNQSSRQRLAAATRPSTRLVLRQPGRRAGGFVPRSGAGSWHGARWGRQVATPATVVPAALAAAGHGEAEHQNEQDRGDDVQDSPHGPPPCPCLSSLSRRTSSTPNDSLYQRPG